jgi:hypothetical protein
LLPELLKCSFGGAEGKKKITELPELTSYLAETHLNIYPKMTLKTFKFNCIVQSFMFPDKASRVVNGVPECPPKMKIQDCGDVKAMSKMIGNYIEAQYRAHYQSQLSKKEKEEREMLTQELVNLMTMTSDIDEFVELFKSGLRRNHVTTLIADTHQLGFVSLKDKLFDPNINVPLRSDKLWIFVMGTTKDNAIVWNKGNVLRMPLLLFQELFEKLSLSAMWNEMYEMYQEKNIYIYRSGKDGELDMPNRHTHCNSKASYWAFGYSTVGKYFADISEMERDAYLRTHTHCCGIWDGKLVKLA